MARLLVLIAVLGPATRLLALDRVVLQRHDQRQTVAGKLLVTARDGGLLLLAPTGNLWTIRPEEIVEQTRDETPFRPLSAGEMSASLAAELPAGFDVYTTAHYVIGYDTSRAYASWCGALLERLHRAFLNFWRRRGFRLDDPELPLVVVVLASAESYQKYGQDELGDASRSVLGYYSLRTNRVTMYDLTGVQALRRRGGRRGSSAEINQVLSRPAAEPLVATVIHEATHQIAFNCGLMARYADIPMWVSEGVAIYFETPDLGSARGWRGIGAVNRARLIVLRQSLGKRQLRSLAALIADDAPFRDARSAGRAYAEAWGWNYFLLQKHSREYLAYVRMLAAKKPLLHDDPQARRRDFRTFFGHDLAGLDREFVRFVQQLQ